MATMIPAPAGLMRMTREQLTQEVRTAQRQREASQENFVRENQEKTRLFNRVQTLERQNLALKTSLKNLTDAM